MHSSNLPEHKILDSIIASSGALVIVVDREGRIREFSCGCEKLTGYSFAEVKGAIVWDKLLAPSDAQRARQTTFETLMHDPNCRENQCTNQWVDKKGKLHRIRWSNNIIPDETGTPEFIVSIGIDITESFETEQSLRLSDAALENALTAIALADLNAAISYVNSKFLELWRFKNADEVIGRSALEFWSSPEIIAEVIKKIRQDGSWFGQLEAKRADGTKSIVELAATLLRDDAGNPTNILGSFNDVTVRVQTERRLRESEKRLNDLLEASPTIIYTADTKEPYGTTYVGSNIRRVFGYRPEQFIDDPGFWINNIHPHDRARVYQNLDELFKRGTHIHEYRFRTLDGEYRWVHDELRLIRNANGDPVEIVGSWMDINSRIASQAALKASEIRLNEAQRIAKVGSWELDLTNNRLEWSDEIFRMFEIDKNQFGASYEAFLNAIHPDDRDAVNAAYSNSLSTREPYEIVHRLRMTDGRIKYVRETCESYFDDEGKPLRSVGAVQDITEIHKAELQLSEYREHLEELVQQRSRQLVESEQRLKDAQKIAHLGHWRLDQKTGLLEWSDEVYAIHGLDREHFRPTIESYYRDWVVPEDVARVQTEERQAYESGLHSKVDYRVKRVDGQIRWVHVEGVADIGNDGYPFLKGIVQDITERKIAEAALVLAKEEAEAANRAKSEFLSRMSHELRTPMNAILGFAQLLEMEKLESNELSFVHEIHRAGDHLLELINELLDLSRIESGKLAIATEPLNVHNVVNEALQIVKSQIDKKNIMVRNDCDREIYVLADRTRLKQVMVNLLSNATKYNRQDGKIIVNTDVFPDKKIRVSVADSGQGIAAEKLPLLFTPFQRLGEENNGVDGAGIGLALSKQLAILMGGDLVVETKLGTGSTFSIELPMAEKPHEETEAEIAQSLSTSEWRATVLYVEDNAANLRLIETIFRQRPKIQLLSATNGEEGLNLAKRYQPDLILLDIHLPGIDGYSVLRQLRGNPQTRMIPVYALSADAMSADIKKGNDAGFDQYITKPIDVQRVLADVDDFITKKNR